MSSFFVSLFWFLLFFGGAVFLAYRRVDLRTSTVAAGAAVLAYTFYTFSGYGYWLWMLLLWAAFGVLVIPNLIDLRRENITRPLLEIYRKMLPSMSDTEKEAPEAGNTGGEGGEAGTGMGIVKQAQQQFPDSVPDHDSRKTAKILLLGSAVNRYGAVNRNCANQEKNATRTQVVAEEVGD